MQNPVYRKNVLDLVCLSLIWWGLVGVVNPIGHFPLNDDWSYGIAVERLLSTGDFRPQGWTSMPLLTHTLWGALFCLPDTFSFTSLRFSTLTMGWIGLMASYMLIFSLFPSRLLACIAAAAVAFNPIYFSLSHTFMTDVPYTAQSILGAFFLVLHLKTGSRWWLALGIACLLLATLSRQLALCLPAAFALTLLWRERMTPGLLMRAGLPLGICLVALMGWQHWLDVSGRLPAMYSVKSADLMNTLLDPQKLIKTPFKNARKALMYLGLFLLPLLLVIGLHKPWVQKNRWRFLAWLLALAVTLPVILKAIKGKSGAVMPMIGNIWIPSGIGPLTLRDTLILNMPHVSPLAAEIWITITVLSLLGAVFLCFGFVRWLATEIHCLRFHQQNSDQHRAGLFLLLALLIYMAPPLIAGLFDRYMIPVVALAAGAIAAYLPRDVFVGTTRTSLNFRLFCALTLMLAMGWMAVAGTHDYLAAHRAKWVLLNGLMKEGISPESIDGGFEFNGYTLYDDHYKPSPDKSWWWVKEDEYQLAYGPMPGLTIEKQATYRRWITGGTQGSIYLLRKPLPTMQ